MTDILRILDRGYELIWREDDLERALGGLPEDFEWVVPGHPEGDIRRGPEAVIEFFREWREPFEELDVSWELHAIGEGRALAITRMRGRGRESAAPVEMHFGQIWTFAGARPLSMVVYLDLAEARAAAGL